jgi:hypothetical protein
VSEPNDPNHEDQSVLTHHLSIPPPDDQNEHPDQEDPPDPDSDPEPEHGSDSGDDSANAHNLTQSLKLLARNIAGISAAPKSSNSIKPRTSDTFNSSDSSKLETFIFQCLMYISACAKDFPDEESRISFSLSFLKGTPLDWFQTKLNHFMTNSSEFPKWFLSYPLFLLEFQRLFGLCDPVNDTMITLKALKYKDSTKATLDFNHHSHRTGWNEATLSHLHYKGLPDRLKDEISRIRKPTSLFALQNLVATLDQRHWEHQSEISHDKKPLTLQPNKLFDKSSDNHSDNCSSPPQNNSNTKGRNQQQQLKNKNQKKAPATSSSSNSGNKSISIADILGPDSKLKSKKRQRHMDNRLCLCCSGPSHVANDCTKTTSSKPKPKAWAATVASTSASTAAPATSLASGKPRQPSALSTIGGLWICQR